MSVMMYTPQILFTGRHDARSAGVVNPEIVMLMIKLKMKTIEP